MHKEIGSNFWLNRYSRLEDAVLNLDFLQLNISDTAFLSTGRSSISFVLEQLNISKENKVALLPPFTCHTVIEPFITAGYEVHFYRLNQDLSCNKETFLGDIQKYNPDVVLVHGYFGFNTLKPIKEVIQHLKESNIIFIEDITQTVYSEFEHIDAQYYVCSLRKWTALPDGGFALSTKDQFIYKPEDVDISLEEAKLSAFHAKYLYMTKDMGEKNKFLKMLQQAEQILSEQELIYAMSPMSKKLQGNLNLNILRSRRRENFRTLLEGLISNNNAQPIFKSLPDNVTPLYFPVYVNCDRKELQSYLAKKDIYVPIVWPKPVQCEGAINDEVNWIYQHILAIPCDQRYRFDDMERIINSIEEFNKI